jgi:hypothetical protein
MKKKERPLSHRLGRAVAYANPDSETRKLVIKEYERVISGEITEQQMDPIVKSMLSKVPNS